MSKSSSNPEDSAEAFKKMGKIPRLEKLDDVVFAMAEMGEAVRRTTVSFVLILAMVLVVDGALVVSALCKEWQGAQRSARLVEGAEADGMGRARRPLSARPSMEKIVPAVASLAILASCFLAVWCGSRIREMRLVGGVLRVRLAWWERAFDLAGLQSVVPDEQAMEGSRKRCGSSGFRAYIGTFSSKRLGAFLAYVTDPKRAVVLRWEGQCVVVSSKDTAWFIEEICKRTGVPRPS